VEQARQQALEMKDELILGYQRIRDKFYNETGGEITEPKPKSKKQINRDYKTGHQQINIKPLWISEPEGIEWLQKVDVFFDCLINELEDTNTSFDEIRDEIFIIIRTVNRNGDPTTIDLATCSKESFGIAMVRICLKENNLQMQYAPNWKQFAKHYTRYIMDVI